MNEEQVVREVAKEMKKFEAEYSNPTILQRLKVLAGGIGKPRGTKEYKEAMIELQRLSAPATAVFLPVILVGLLILVSSGEKAKERIIETQIMEATKVEDLQKEEEPPEKPPEVDNDVQIDVPVDSVNVRVDAAVAPSANVSTYSAKPQAFDAVMQVKSPVIMKNVYGSTRSTGQRGKALKAYGGDAKTEAAVLRALRWLKKNQNPDGSWGGPGYKVKYLGPAQYVADPVAMTGLAILTYLAHGEKPGADSPEFGPTVQRALEYMLKMQFPTTGTWGSTTFTENYGRSYVHLIATYAVCEAYGMTGNPNLERAAARGIAQIMNGQHPTGGWTYEINQCKPGLGNDAGGYRDDTSVMGWAVQALKAAKLANIQPEGKTHKDFERVWKLAVRGFKKNAHPKGGFGYCNPGNGGLTSVGVLCMMFLGAGNDKAVRDSLDLMDRWQPAFSDYYAAEKRMAGGTTFEAAQTAYLAKLEETAKNADVECFYRPGDSQQYYFYYATQCRFHAGGKRWEMWNKVMKPVYVAAQKVIPASESGYVDDKNIPRAIGCWWNLDRFSTPTEIMSTCLTALQLMVYYRYLPTTKQSAVQAVEELSAVSAVDKEDIQVDTGTL